MNGIKLNSFEKLYHLPDVLYKNYSNYIFINFSAVFLKSNIPFKSFHLVICIFVIKIDYTKCLYRNNFLA